jgi:hypothetical protein
MTAIAFSSEVETGSREENASNQKSAAGYRLPEPTAAKPRGIGAGSGGAVPLLGSLSQPVRRDINPDCSAVRGSCTKGSV